MNYAKQKYHLILVGRTREKLEKAAKQLEEQGAICEIIVYDMLQEEFHNEFPNVIKDVAKRVGGIDIAVAVAGTAGHMAEAYKGDEWGLEVVRRITRTNVDGTLTFVMSCWESMVEFKSGHICVIGSSAGVFAPATFCAYGATKAYWYHFAQMLRVVSVPYGIEVTTALPGFIDTRMTKNMRSWYSSLPDFMFGSAQGMGSAIVRGIATNTGVINWPLNHLLPLYGARALHPLNEELGRLVGAASMATGVTMS